MRVRKTYIWVAGLIIVLLLAAGLYALLGRDKTQSIPGVSKQQSKQVDGEIAAEGADLTPLPTSQAILLAPDPEASAGSFEQYRANVEYNAVADNSITLSACNPNPTVVKVVEGSKIMLENRDNKTHTIMINEDNTFAIDANGTREITVDFGKGLGIYTYECDDSARPVGAIVVRQTL